MAILYQAAIVGRSGTTVLRELEVAPDPYAQRLVEGVSASEDEHDALIASFLRRDWRLDRIALLDRIVLRIASYELASEPEVPTAVIIDEAVELAKSYSSEQAPAFVNGVLRSIAAHARGQKPASLAFAPTVRPTLSVASAPTVDPATAIRLISEGAQRVDDDPQPDEPEFIG